MARRSALKLKLSRAAKATLDMQVDAGLYGDLDEAVEQAVLCRSASAAFSSEADLLRIVEESERSGKPRPLTDRDFQRLHDMVDRVVDARKPARRKSARASNGPSTSRCSPLHTQT